MKFILGSVPFIAFGALLCVGIVKHAQPEGSAWLLIVGTVLFLGLMLKCCLPVKH